MQKLISMPNISWDTLPIIAIASLSSAAIGALIQAAVSTYRNRKQPIGIRVDVYPKFDAPLGSSLGTQITFSDGQKDYKYDDLRLVGIRINNQGDQDFNPFKLGITLPDTHVGVYAETQSPDHQHQVQQLTPLTFAEPQSHIDFVLHPLNRGDAYSLRLLVLASGEDSNLENTSFSSSQAIRFVNLPSIEEVVQETARSTALSLGPLKLSFK